MKVYCYNDYEVTEAGEEIHFVAEITDQQILYDYWDYWSGRMIEKFGDKSDLITHDKCIEDWLVVHWGWEKK